jgi:plastocyanin
MTPSPQRLAVSAIAAIVVTVVGVGAADMTLGGRPTGSGDDRSTDAPAPSEGSDGGTASRLTIVDFAYDPTPATVVAGEPLTIVNEDGAEHTVTSGTRDDAGADFDVDVAANGSGELVLESPGTFEYICRIHPGMKGTLEVVP